MAGYGARKAPSVSQYVANLNAIPSAQDVAAGQQDNFPDLEEELAQFTNTEFLNFDADGFSLEQPGQELEHGHEDNAKRAKITHDDVDGLDFVNGQSHSPMSPMTHQSSSFVSKHPHRHILPSKHTR